MRIIQVYENTRRIVFRLKDAEIVDNAEEAENGGNLSVQHEKCRQVVNGRYESYFRGELAGEMTVDGRSSRLRKRSSSRSSLKN